MVKGRSARAFRRVYHHELAAGRSCDAIPEPLAGEPVRPHPGAMHQGRGVVRKELLGARIISRRERARLRKRGRTKQENHGETHTGKPNVYIASRTKSSQEREDGGEHVPPWAGSANRSRDPQRVRYRAE